MRYYFTLLACFFCSFYSFSQTEFITTWKTDNPGASEDNQITIPTYSGNFGAITINWGDGTAETFTNSFNLSHTYSNPGTYSIRITGNFPGYYFKDWGDNKKIISVDQWGDVEWVTAQEAFSGCENLDVLADDTPNLSKVTSTNQMFSGCTSLIGTPAFNDWNVSSVLNMDSMFNSCTNFNAPIGNWDVSNVEKMPAVFFNATSFNQDIANWNVSNVKIMWAMFAGAHSFNQNIENWDVSNVTVMGWMFANARSFNMPIENWDVSNVTSMDLMFDNALVFNQSLSLWNVSSVTNLAYMFNNSKYFNQPIGNWDVSSVTNMNSMFRNAETFNQPLNNWDMSNVTNTSNMFFYAFDFRQDISSWNVSNVVDMSGMFNGATAFNRPINNWDVSEVMDMTRMFQYAYSFNQDVSNWDVGNVTVMDNMFHRADTFKQDISAWNIGNVTSMMDMFLDIKLSKITYDNILNSWSSLHQLQDGVIFNAGNSEYCDGKTAKEDLRNNHSWIITDGGEVCFLTNQFVTKWKTDNLGSSGNNQITIPTFPIETYNYTVDWGDGNVDSNVTGSITHTYDNSGIYYVSISGTFPRIYFNEIGDKDKLLTINQWGSNQWTSMESAFAHCSNLSVAAQDTPDLSNATSLRKMFFYCGYAFDDSGNREFPNFNGVSNFNDWDVSTITDMSNMFDKSAFYQNISEWDVSNVIDMSYMFFSSTFNFDISNWDVSNVRNMSGTFGSSSFKQDVTGWDVSSVTNMDFMFNSTFFDQDISLWDVSKVTSMRHMLSQCSFNKDISSWNVSNVSDMSNIFDDNDLSRENYDKILIGWSQLPSLQFGITLGAKDVKYCAGKDARQFLIDNYNWFFVDQSENCEAERPFITTWKTNNPGPSEDNQITIPTNPREVYNYSVDWGDGNTDTGITEDITHTYSQPGIYQISITGRFPHIYFNNGGPGNYPHQTPSKISDNKKIISIDQWGTIRWNSMAFAFAGCSNMDVLATDSPDFSKDIYLSGMFYGCTSLKGNRSMSQWDLSYTSFMARDMFSQATSFNQPIGEWDVSNIRYLNNMFNGATAFNQSLENWNIRSVQEMESLFDGSGLSTTNYDKTINAWSTLPFLVNNVELGAANVNYCNSSTARQFLIDNYGWEIIDAGNDCSSTYFITTWKTDNTGVSEDNQITIPTFPGETYDFTVDWGDGTSDTKVAGDITHSYSTQGIYQVAISGNFPGLYFAENTDKEKITLINQWGETQLLGLSFAFRGCKNMDIIAVDTPDLSSIDSLAFAFSDCESLVGNEMMNAWDISSITNLNSTFSGAINFNSDISNWDTSNVTNMSAMFDGATSFNQNINIWNVSNVTNMRAMFFSADSFDQPIEQWDVSKVQDMFTMFAGAKAFNQPIGNWDVSNVENMGAMFSNGTSFNQNINTWNVGKVTNMNVMFAGAVSFNSPLNDWDVTNVLDMEGMFRDTNFNQDISNWDVSKVVTFGSMFAGSSTFNQPLNSWNVSNANILSGMFSGASSFNQDISSWDVSNVLLMNGMFFQSNLSFKNYDKLLNGWSQLSSLQPNVTLNVGNSQYCESEEARQYLIDTYGWTITDGGKDALCNQDNDLDGVLDHKDNCLDTRPNVTVNDNGCEIIALGAILVYGSTPTCPGEANGGITISSSLVDYTFNISIEGPVSSEYENSSLNEPLEVSNLSTGVYLITISKPDISYTQSYGIQINEVGSITGKRANLNTNSKSVSYNVEGSYSYTVDLNGAFKTFQFETDGFNEIVLSDLDTFNSVAISGESACQGLITDSFTFSDGIIIYPTITKNRIYMEGYEELSTVLIYDSSGRLLITKKLTQQNLESVDFNGLEPGMYPTVIESKGTSKTFKIIKQ